MDAISEAAASLLSAFLAGQTCPPVSDSCQLSLEDCYAVQSRVVDARCVVLNEERIGYKIGLTNPVPRDRLGAQEPVFAPLTSGSLLRAPARIDAAELHHPRIEVELAFVVRRALGASPTESDIVASCDVALGLEINATRSRLERRSSQMTLADLVCDQCLAAYVVLGDRVAIPTRDEINAIEVELRHNGLTTENGNASTVMGSPLAAMSWLIDTIAKRGTTLPAGAVVFTGNMLRAGVELQPGRYTAYSTNPVLGHVESVIDSALAPIVVS